MPKSLIVNVSVSDLRREPCIHAGGYEKDPLQESQVLYGEYLIGHEERDGWVFVEAIEQQKYTSQKWQGYPGWVQKSHVLEGSHRQRKNPLIVQVPWATIQVESQKIPVSLGTHLEGKVGEIQLADGRQGQIPLEHVRDLPPTPSLTLEMRQDLLATGHQLLGQPYLWGGFSAYRPDRLSSCDCSGLVGLLYRLQGINLPRDAHDQFFRCEKLSYADLLPGDLIFLAPADKPERMGHVMLFAGGDELLDANITDGKTVCSTGLSRFGRPFESLAWGEQIDKYMIYYGRFTR